MASTAELPKLSAPTVLRDGSCVRLRQGRADDRELLLRAFERLSDESRYLRFLAPMPELTGSMLRYLLSVDHHDHESIIALDERDGEAVGVARYVRRRERPDVAELAVTVVDDWQGRGLGTALMDAIAARARQEGITAFTVMMLASNQPMMSLLEHLSEVRVLDRESGTVEIEVPIPPIGLPRALQRLLRLAARRDIGLLPLGDARHDRDVRAVTPAGKASASPRSPPRAPLAGSRSRGPRRASE
jgi:GNAT superfamily N-acetyltransferase